VAADAFQALGRLGLEIRIDDHAADALLVHQSDGTGMSP
jgi:hypothetical protein